MIFTGSGSSSGSTWYHCSGVSINVVIGGTSRERSGNKHIQERNVLIEWRDLRRRGCSGRNCSYFFLMIIQALYCFNVMPKCLVLQRGIK